MAGPYLKSGESIILTTDRVLVGETEYDLILTSQRLALVDSDHTSDEPQVIPFSTVFSVKGSTTPAREPVITLAISDPSGSEETKNLDLVFSQQPYEDRAAECDLWVKKLIEYIVSYRQEPVTPGKKTEDKRKTGINPTVRRFGAPEMPHPHMGVAANSQRPPEDLLSAIQKIAQETITEKEESTESFQSPIPITDEILPETEPESEIPSVQTALEPEPDAGSPEMIHDASKEPQATCLGEETDDEPVLTAEETALSETEKRGVAPEAPFQELIPEPCPQADKPVISGDAEFPGVDSKEEREKSLTPLSVPETGTDAMPPGPETTVGSMQDSEEISVETQEDYRTGHDLLVTQSKENIGLPATVTFPVLTPSENTGEEEVTAGSQAREKWEVPCIPTQQGSEKIPVKKIATVILILFLVFGGGAVVLHMLAESGHNPQPASTFSNTTPVLSPAITSSPVPSEGVWLMVQYNGTYFGEYGNPGDLREVRGTGTVFYLIKNSSALVQASIQKLDYSGDTLTVSLYNNGRMVTEVNKSSPQASVALLVNPDTGKPPFVPVTTIVRV